MTAEEASRQLAGRATRSGIWVLSGRFGDAVLRFIANIILAGLLFPEAFGLMGLVNIFLMGLQLFSDTGIGPSIVRSQRGEDPVFLRTAWTVQVIRGAILSLLCLGLATPFALLYDEPELRHLIPWAGLSAFLGGLRSPNWFLADRRMVQHRKTFINLASQVASVAVMIIWASIDRSIDALVAGTLVSTGLHALLTHLFLPGPRSYFQMERTALHELFDFGRWIFLSTALTFLAMQGDRLFLGKVIPSMAMLGVYMIALRMIELVTTILQQVSSAVVLPAWSESHRISPSEHPQRVLQSRLGLMSLGVAGLTGVATLAPALFGNFYNAEYQDAILYTQMLIVPGWLQILKSTSTSAALVYGDSRALSIANLLNLLITAPACVIGFYMYGLPGFIVGTSLGTLAGNLPLLKALRSHGCPLGAQDLLLSLRLAVLAGIGIFLPMLWSTGEVSLSQMWWQLPFAAVLGILAIAPARHTLPTRKPSPA